MTIFDYLNDIFKNKTGTLCLDQYSPYIINRWVSFIDPSINELINKLNSTSLLEDKELHYKTLLSLLPKTKNVPRIQYIKRIKEEKTSIDAKVELLSKQFDVSTREVQLLIDSISEIQKSTVV